MHDALLGAAKGSGTDTDTGAEPGEMEAGLQMDEAADVLNDDGTAPDGFPPRPAAAAAPGLAEVLEAELEDDAELDTAGGVNWPLLSEPELSRTGDDFFLAGRLFVPPPLCCCWRHLARRFLNQTCSRPGRGQSVSKARKAGYSPAPWAPPPRLGPRFALLPEATAPFISSPARPSPWPCLPSFLPAPPPSPILLL